MTYLGLSSFRGYGARVSGEIKSDFREKVPLHDLQDILGSWFMEHVHKTRLRTDAALFLYSKITKEAFLR